MVSRILTGLCSGSGVAGARRAQSRRILGRAVLVLLAATAPAGRLLAANAAASGPETGRTRTARLLLRRKGLSLRLAPLPVTLTEAFFQGRGFTAAASRQIAQTCVFKVVVRNRSAARILKVNLADWRVSAGGHRLPLRLESDWRRIWMQQHVSRSLQIAFRYSLLPSVMQLGPADWLQGMVSTGLAPGQRFNLDVYWWYSGVPEHASMRALRCPLPAQEIPSR